MSYECQIEKNKQFCTCTYKTCSKKGKCCECVIYHRQNNEIPGCFFLREAEKTYDRSIQNFIDSYKKEYGNK